MNLKKIIALSLVSVLSSMCIAQVRLPRIIRDSMVLQRDMPIKIWGWAAPNEKVNLRFKNRSYKARADQSGQWQVKLPATAAGGPYSIVISASNSITLKDVLFGDVWFCSGQSNMVHQLNIHDVTYAKEIAEANYPQIRQFWIPTLTNVSGPETDLPAGNWKSAVGEDVRPFSAVAYFFAKKIYEKYHVPIGIINASVGGSPIQTWISEEGFAGFPSLQATVQKNKDTAYVNGLIRNAAARRPARPQPTDLGLAGDLKWYDPAYMPKGWRPINVPGFWEDQGLKDLNGIVWYRREVDIPASMTGKPARIFLGRIVDADELYINGHRVGNTTYMYPQRRYHIAPGVLKPGKNIFVVRVTNNAGEGGFVVDKPYCIFAGSDTVDLKGTWHYKVGAAFRPFTPGRPGAGFGGGFNPQSQPAAFYNAMVAPEINYAIKGFCWYQGESNASNPSEYAPLQAALIHDWRNKWQEDTLPFLFVQLPNFMDYNYQPSASNWARLREAQLQSLSVPNTAMAIAIDLGEWNDIHPDNKKAVGDRLALCALKLAYHEDIEWSGPLYQSSVIEGNKIVVQFTHAAGGLITNDEEVPGDFAVAGADKKFVWAHARIEGDKIVVWSDEVPEPKFVRYAWADNPVHANVYNKEGLPACPFRTDQ